MLAAPSWLLPVSFIEQYNVEGKVKLVCKTNVMSEWLAPLTCLLLYQVMEGLWGLKIKNSSKVNIFFLCQNILLILKEKRKRKTRLISSNLRLWVLIISIFLRLPFASQCTSLVVGTHKERWHVWRCERCCPSTGTPRRPPSRSSRWWPAHPARSTLRWASGRPTANNRSDHARENLFSLDLQHQHWTVCPTEFFSYQ